MQATALYRDSNLPAINNLLQDADNQLFKSVLTNTEHILHHYILQRTIVIIIIILGPAYIIKKLYPKPVHLMIESLLYVCCTRIPTLY